MPAISLAYVLHKAAHSVLTVTLWGSKRLFSPFYGWENRTQRSSSFRNMISTQEGQTLGRPCQEAGWWGKNLATRGSVGHRSRG